MSKKVKSLLLKYGITACIGGLMSYAVIWSYGFEQAVTTADRYHILADAFTIPGVVLMLIWVLVWLSNEGALEGVVYGLSYAVKMLIPGPHKQERYGDYVMRRREQGKVKGFGFIFFTGLAYFIVAVIFIALYYSVR